jgi:hypothetical protein
MFAFHEVFFDTTRSQNGQLYLFSHGIMMVHWDNAKAGKRFHDTPENDSEPNDITDNFDIRFFGNSHHDKLAFIADVKRALVWHSDDLNGPVELTFPSVFWN